MSRWHVLGFRSRHSFRRRLTGWVAIYALVLQGFIIGFAGLHGTAGAAPGHEICLSAAGDDGAAPGDLPSQQAKIHCGLCATGGPQLVVPARASVAAIVVAEPGAAPWTVSDPPAKDAFQYSDKRSRAPPAAA